MFLENFQENFNYKEHDLTDMHHEVLVELTEWFSVSEKMWTKIEISQVELNLWFSILAGVVVQGFSFS
jgi:hypothetical protein